MFLGIPVYYNIVMDWWMSLKSFDSIYRNIEENLREQTHLRDAVQESCFW